MKAFSLADKFITGFIMLLGMAETGHLLMVFGHRPFSDAFRLFLIESAVLLILAVCGGLWSRRAGGRMDARRRPSGRERTAIRVRSSTFTGKDITPVLAGAFLVCILFILYQIMTIMSGDNIDRSGDMTLETVESILETGTAYEMNPLTGHAYTAGVPMRIKILGLPTFYAILCRLADICGAGSPADAGGGRMSHWLLLTKWVPLLVLCLSYLAFWTMAKALFPDPKDREQRMMFMALTAAVLCVGSYAFGMDGFGLLYCGYRGVTIRGTILLPYTFGLALRHKWKLMVFCILAEGCIVWTLYGMGTCLIVALGMGLLRLWQKKRSGNLSIFGEEV